MKRFGILLAVQACLGVQLPAHAAQLHALVLGQDGKPLPNVVVVAIPEDGQLPALKRTVEIVDQIDKEFVPYVKPVRVGSYVQFPNKDNIQHHVYSFSPPKKFELPLYSGTPSQPVLFDKPGIVKLGCNIHDWMLGYVYVTETPYFGKTGIDGRVDLDQLPPGRYVARVWHPLMEGSETTTIKHIDLGDTTTSSLEWKLKLKPEFRPRRTPLPNEPGYR
jgi:plastocyanin